MTRGEKATHAPNCYLAGDPGAPDSWCSCTPSVSRAAASQDEVVEAAARSIHRSWCGPTAEVCSAHSPVALRVVARAALVAARAAPQGEPEVSAHLDEATSEQVEAVAGVLDRLLPEHLRRHRKWIARRALLAARAVPKDDAEAIALLRQIADDNGLADDTAERLDAFLSSLDSRESRP